jgi:transcriptional regulator GlxA family with amidase domain
VTVNSRSATAASSAVRRVIGVIHERFAEDLSLQELADVARVSRFHLARLFRHHTGASVLEYVRSVRVAEAKRLLRRGDVTVDATAGAVGYSTAQLIRVFKDATGLTPAAWARLRR